MVVMNNSKPLQCYQCKDKFVMGQVVISYKGEHYCMDCSKQDPVIKAHVLRDDKMDTIP